MEFIIGVMVGFAGAFFCVGLLGANEYDDDLDPTDEELNDMLDNIEGEDFFDGKGNSKRLY